MAATLFSRGDVLLGKDGRPPNQNGRRKIDEQGRLNLKLSIGSVSACRRKVEMDATNFKFFFLFFRWSI